MIRDQLQERIVDLELEGLRADPGHQLYSPELFVLSRLIEFPFEEYPSYCYPAAALSWPSEHVRWHHVEQTIRFCESLCQPKGSDAGKPVRLLGFQVLILYCILGPENPDTRLRQARTCVMTISRKNGKSALIGMLFLAMVSLDAFNLRAQDIHVGSGDKNQASILYDIIEKLILMDRKLGLSKVYHLIPSKKTVVHKKTFSKIICLSSDTFRAHGLNSYAVLLDEFGNIPDSTARAFYGVLTSGFGSQSEPLTLLFSTQAPSDIHPFSEFVDQAKKANVAETADEAGLVGFIFDLPKEDDGTRLVFEVDSKTRQPTKVVDVFAEANWGRSNPALDTLNATGFRRIKDMRAKASEAQKMPSLVSAFRNLNLNQRVAALTPFISAQTWTRTLVPRERVEELLAGPCYLGLDLSSRRDLTAKARTWRQPDDSLVADVTFWTPADGVLEKVKTDKVPFDVWIEQGHVVATPGSSVDYNIVAESVVEDTQAGEVERIAFDRWRMDQLRQEMRACGFDPYLEDDDPFWQSVGQGFKDMTRVLEAFEEMVLQGRLRVVDNPCLTWCVSNALVTKDAAEGRKLDKAKSYGRIDGLVALIMAVFAASEVIREERAGEQESEYDKGEKLLVL